jgi:NADPH-dependent ferric siderophore reductase
LPSAFNDRLERFLHRAIGDSTGDSTGACTGDSAGACTEFGTTRSALLAAGLQGVDESHGCRVTAARLRREPPRFRRVEVRRVEARSPRLQRVTLAGPELGGLAIEQPAASVRLLLPSSADAELVLPVWNGNEFLLADGQRPVIRTLTPRRLNADALELDLEVVVHGRGAASEWAQRATPGDTAAISGPGRGYAIDREAPGFLLAGDETAIPAISQLLEALPPDIPTQVRMEVAYPDARLELSGHPLATVEWRDLPSGASPGDALVAAVRDADIAIGTRVWAAGEAASVQRIRRYLFEERGLPRAETSVRGYWQRGRRGDTADA